MHKYTSELVEITHDEYVPTETICQDETVWIHMLKKTEKEKNTPNQVK